MQVIECNGFGAPDVMRVGSRPVPQPQSDEVLIKVAAAGINRADMLQRKGKYPVPAGASDILGMEVSGTIVGMGSDVRRWKNSDRVCALLGGGGYAEYAVVTESHCLPVPDKVDLLQAAALPEAIVTVYANIFDTGALKPGETVLVHGGSSGIGTTAIQMIRLFGGHVFTTAGSDSKCAACDALGADLTINYNNKDFVEVIDKKTQGSGIDIVLDMVGGDYVGRNLSILGKGGRHISIATQASVKAEIDLREIMQKRLTVTGSTLRGRSKAEKTALIARIEREIWPWVGSGQLKPVIYQSLWLKNAPEAHKMMESGVHIGKIVLEIS